MSPAPEPDDLRNLGARLDQVRHQRGAKKGPQPPSALGIGFRFATELVAALIVGGGIGFGLDYGLGAIGVHTRPVFLLVFFVLGAAAGIRNVMSAAKELNEQAASAANLPSVADDGDEEQ